MLLVSDAYVYRGVLSQYDTGIMTNNVTILRVTRSVSALRVSVLEYRDGRVRKKDDVTLCRPYVTFQKYVMLIVIDGHVSAPFPNSCRP